MAVIIKTENPRGLLSTIKTAIDNGKIVTWEYDDDGDFNHTANQWKNRAWLRPSVSENSLVFYILPPRIKQITSVVYAVYHGRFIEMLLSHFDKRFTEASATALPIAGDRIEGQSS